MPSALQLFVLDALANDLEDLASIHRWLNHPDVGWCREYGGAIEVSEGAEALAANLRAGLVEAFALDDAGTELHPLAAWQVLDTEDLDSLWFGLTEAGRRTHADWDPPERSGSG